MQKVLTPDEQAAFEELKVIRAQYQTEDEFIARMAQCLIKLQNENTQHQAQVNRITDLLTSALAGVKSLGDSL